MISGVSVWGYGLVSNESVSKRKPSASERVMLQVLFLRYRKTSYSRVVKITFKFISTLLKSLSRPPLQIQLPLSAREFFFCPIPH